MFMVKLILFSHLHNCLSLSWVSGTCRQSVTGLQPLPYQTSTQFRDTGSFLCITTRCLFSNLIKSHGVPAATYLLPTHLLQGAVLLLKTRMHSKMSRLACLRASRAHGVKFTWSSTPSRNIRKKIHPFSPTLNKSLSADQATLQPSMRLAPTQDRFAAGLAML